MRAAKHLVLQILGHYRHGAHPLDELDIDAGRALAHEAEEPSEASNGGPGPTRPRPHSEFYLECTCVSASARQSRDQGRARELCCKILGYTIKLLA